MNTESETSKIHALRNQLRERLRSLSPRDPERRRIRELLGELEHKRSTKPAGRPPLDPERLKSPAISFRTRMPLYRDLRKSAATAGRSVSAEAEFRLEQSLGDGWLEAQLSRVAVQAFKKALTELQGKGTSADLSANEPNQREDAVRRGLDRAQEAIEHARQLPKHHSKFLLGRSLEMIEDARGKLDERRRAELGPDVALVLQTMDKLYDAIEGADTPPDHDRIRVLLDEFIQEARKALSDGADQAVLRERARR